MGSSAVPSSPAARRFFSHEVNRERPVGFAEQQLEQALAKKHAQLVDLPRTAQLGQDGGLISHVNHARDYRCV
jgi:hypothetical protein